MPRILMKTIEGVAVTLGVTATVASCSTPPATPTP